MKQDTAFLLEAIDIAAAEAISAKFQAMLVKFNNAAILDTAEEALVEQFVVSLGDIASAREFARHTIAQRLQVEDKPTAKVRENDTAFRARIQAEVGTGTVNQERIETDTGAKLDELGSIYGMERMR